MHLRPTTPQAGGSPKNGGQSCVLANESCSAYSRLSGRAHQDDRRAAWTGDCDLRTSCLTVNTRVDSSAEVEMVCRQFA